MNRKKVKLGKYKHFKGKKYEAIGIAKDSETLENFVIYKALYGNKELWIRPEKMFLETIIIKNKKIKRFSLINLPKQIKRKDTIKSK